MQPAGWESVFGGKHFHSDLGDPEAGAVRLCVWGGVGGGHL